MEVKMENKIDVSFEEGDLYSLLEEIQRKRDQTDKNTKEWDELNAYTYQIKYLIDQRRMIGEEKI